MAEAFFGPHERITHLREIVAAEVFQLTTFEQVPNTLLRVQVRSVAGKPLQMKSLGCTSCQKLLDGLRTVDRGPIPNHQQLARDLAPQQASKRDHLFGARGLLWHLHEEPPLWSHAANG